MERRETSRPRILVVTSVLAVPGGNPWLLDDLVSALQEHADVDVLVLDVNTPRARGRNDRDGVRVWSVGPEGPAEGLPRRLAAYVRGWVRLHTEVAPRLRRGTYDLAVFTSPGTVTAGFPARVRRAGVARRLLFVLWDFFPVHHAEIGRIPSGMVEQALKRVERACIEDCDVIAVMTARNEEFLRAYHPGLRAGTVILPPWSADATEALTDSKRDRFTVVFGGQLTLGRGVETLVDAAQILQERGVDAAIEIYGWGPAREELADRAARSGIHLLTFHDPLPRHEYRRMLRTVHAGVAVTVPDVSVPTFPSKIVDYGQAGIAVVACLEDTSDVGALITQSGAGVTCSAGDSVGLAAALEDLAAREASTGDATTMGQRSRSLYESTMSADSAARTVLAVALGTDATTGKQEGSRT